MLIGYARVSTTDQDLEAQRAELIEMGVAADRIYVDHGATGGNVDREGLRQAQAAVRAGDTLVVTKLDRLGRSLRDLSNIAQELQDAGVLLRIGNDVYNPDSPIGQMMFNIFGTFAQFERDIIRERTRAGMAAPAVRARLRPREPSLKPKDDAMILRMYRDEKATVSHLARLFKLSRSSIYRALERARKASPEGGES